MLSGITPYLAIPGFLDDHAAQTLLDWMLRHEARFSPSRVDYGAAGDGFRQSMSARLDKPFKEMFKTSLERRFPEVLRVLGVPAFGHRYEMEAVAYNDGAYLRRHVDVRADRGETGAQLRVDRRISAVYYFHRAPKSFSGGQLRIYPLLAGQPVELEPEQNLLVAFPAFAPHEVLPVSCPSRIFADSRFTINIWLHATANTPVKH